jgi:hypothetical protein
MGRAKDICPSEHGHTRVGEDRFRCSYADCSETFTTLSSAHKHSTTTCPFFKGERPIFECPLGCGHAFAHMQNAIAHSYTAACPNHPTRLSNPEYRTTVSHAVVDEKKYCNACKCKKELSEFSKSTKSRSGYAYVCKRCFSIHEMFQKAKKRREQEGHTLDFTLEDIKGLVVETCPVFGVPLQYGGDDFNPVSSATIDAMNHSMGHVKGNLRIISAKANTVKNNSTPEEMKKLFTCMQGWTPPSVEEISKKERSRHTIKDGKKACSACQLEFPIESFPKDVSSRTGHSTRCTRCSAVRAMLQNAKTRALKKNVPFEIDFEYLFQIAPVCCPILGMTLQYGNGKTCDISASLDRFDPAKGYVKGNVWVICHKANRMKSDATIDDIASVCNYMDSCH